MDPSGTTNFNILNTVGNAKVGAITTATQLEVLGTGIPLFISRGTGSTSTVAATALLRQISTGDMTNGFGPSLRFDAQDNAGVTNVLALIGAVRDGADNSGAIIFNPALGGIPTERMRVSTAGDVGIGTTVPNSKLDVDGNITQSTTHGNNMKLWLSAARNTGGTGEVGLYSWISEPGVTWTGGGIARNMYNQTGFPRVNTGLSGQMLHFTESGNVEFTLETAAGVRTTPLTITNTGNVGIGTTTPNAKLDVNGSAVLGSSTSGGLRVTSIDGLTVALSPSTPNGNVRITDDSQQATRGITIANGGSLGIGTTTPGHRLHVGGTTGTLTGAVRFDSLLGLNGYSPNGCAPAGQFWGLCVGGASGGQSIWNNTSDARLKKNIITIPNALNKVMSLRGVYFDFKDLDGVYKTLPKGHQIGFIAQEVEPVLPEVVSTGGDGMKMMGYGSITALLTEAIKEQQKQLEAEKARNNQQQSEIEQLKKEVEQLKNN